MKELVGSFCAVITCLLCITGSGMAFDPQPALSEDLSGGLADNRIQGSASNLSPYIIDDDFDNGQLDPAWEINFDQAFDWVYTESGTMLTVTDIIKTTINEGWTSVILTRDLASPLSDFNINFGFSWDSEGSPAAMQNVLIQGYSGGSIIIAAGYSDGWPASFGERYGIIDGAGASNTGPDSLNSSGTASININRTSGLINVLWDGSSLISGTNSALIDRIDLVFSYYQDDSNNITSFFGNEAVDFIRVQDSSNNADPPQSVHILTGSSPHLSVTQGSHFLIYGTSGTNEISLDSGARAELINFPGYNQIHIASPPALFTVSRSGTVVIFQGSDGTSLKMSATIIPQSISFNGEENRVLQIYNNRVMLDDQIILSSNEPIVQTGTDSPWPMHRYDSRNTGRSPYAGPSSPLEKWRFMLPSNVVSASPVIGTDGTIYISNGQSGSGGVYAINPDGTQKWLYSGHSGDSAPALSTDGTVYMPGYRNFNAINPDGTLKWTYQAQNVFNYTSPTIGQDGTIYIGCGIDLLALNPGGTLLWQYRVGEDINSTPAVALDGTIYVRSRTDYLCAVNRDGSQKWKLSLGSNPSGYGMSPVIAADGTIYTNGISFYSPGPDYPDFEYNALYAINPDGSTKWIYNAISPGGVGGIGTLVPALDLAGNIYLGGKVNDLWITSAFFALNPSGTLLWSYEMPHPVSFEKSSPAVDVNGIIYFGATNYLYALNPNGTLKWKLPTDIGGSSPAIGSNGTLYFGSGDGYLNAIGN